MYPRLVSSLSTLLLTSQLTLAATTPSPTDTALASPLVLRWNWQASKEVTTPLEWQLHLIHVDDNRTTQGTQVLTPLPASECQRLDKAYQAGRSYCAAFACPASGFHAIALQVKAGKEVSKPSKALVFGLNPQCQVVDYADAFADALHPDGAIVPADIPSEAEASTRPTDAGQEPPRDSVPVVPADQVLPPTATLHPSVPPAPVDPERMEPPIGRLPEDMPPLQERLPVPPFEDPMPTRPGPAPLAPTPLPTPTPLAVPDWSAAFTTLETEYRTELDTIYASYTAAQALAQKQPSRQTLRALTKAYKEGTRDLEQAYTKATRQWKRLYALWERQTLAHSGNVSDAE